MLTFSGTFTLLLARGLSNLHYPGNNAVSSVDTGRATHASKSQWTEVKLRKSTAVATEPECAAAKCLFSKLGATGFYNSKGNKKHNFQIIFSGHHYGEEPL